jgi:hypothetical protein
MSTALAIAGVTAVLRDLLNDGLVNHNVSGTLGSTVSVSVLPPDRVVPANGTETSQLNLFLHQVTPNAGWRNEGLAAVDGAGRRRLGNPALALNLHYLLSAYSGADLHGEILLGYAMQLLHEHPVISRQAIRTALNPSPDVGATLPPALRALADCGLADQIEQLRITPEPIGTDEMSKLWTATQSHYRPTAAYQVTVVLIESGQPVSAPLPVLTRGPVDKESKRERGLVVAASLIPPVPMLDAVVSSGKQPVARLGETVDLQGHHLDGADRAVVLTHSRFDIEETFPGVDPENPSRIPFVIRFGIPADRAGDFPVGVYNVSARVVLPHEDATRETNCLALALAPAITNLPLVVTRDEHGTASFTLNFVPKLRSGQKVSLLLGQQEIVPEPHVSPTGALDFKVLDASKGKHLARLRVDGIESPIIDREAEPPVFLDCGIEIK